MSPKMKHKRNRSISSSRGPYSDTDASFCAPEKSWYEHSVYSRFWQHYSALMYRTHVSAVEHAVYADELQPHLIQRSSRSKRKSSKRRKSKTKMTSASTDSEQMTSQFRHGMHIGADDSAPKVTQPKVEIDEEFLAFMEQSLKHKEEWKRRKEVKNDSSSVVDFDSLVTREHPDDVRSREMKELYGEAAPRLHAMETSVQLAFERISTKQHPKLWPNIPINVLFGD